MAQAPDEAQNLDPGTCSGDAENNPDLSPHYSDLKNGRSLSPNDSRFSCKLSFLACANPEEW